MRRHPSLRLTLAALAVATAAAAEQAKPGPIQVLATGEVTSTAVALNPNGRRALVVWSHLDGVSSILLRGSSLESVGPTTEIEQHIGAHLAPAIAVDGDGRFAVVWQVGFGDEEGGDGDGRGIFLRKLDSAGVPLGDERRVNRDGAFNQILPKVASTADGRLAVAWGERGSGSDPSLVFTAFDADGRRLFRDVRVATTGLDTLVVGGVAAAPGFFSVGSNLYVSSDCPAWATQFRVAVRQIGWDGKSVARPALFDDAHPGGCRGPLLLDLLSSSYGPLAFFLGNDNSNVARFDPETGARPSHRQVIADRKECSASGCPRIVAVAGDDRGRFVVLWETAQVIDCGAATLFHLSAELYGRDGKLRSARFSISDDYASYDMTRPSAAFTSDGTLLVAWRVTVDGETTLLARRLEIR